MVLTHYTAPKADTQCHTSRKTAGIRLGVSIFKRFYDFYERVYDFCCNYGYTISYDLMRFQIVQLFDFMQFAFDFML